MADEEPRDPKEWADKIGLGGRKTQDDGEDMGVIMSSGELPPGPPPLPPPEKPSKGPKQPKQWVCVECHYIGEPEKIKRPIGCLRVIIALLVIASIASINVGTLLFCIVAGAILEIWASGKSAYRCPSCQSERIIPADSPKGREILGK